MMQLPSIQQALSYEKCGKWTIELLDESLALVDLSGFAREVVCLVIDSVQELESLIRRNRGETATTEGINLYMVSRKKINKMVYNYIKSLKSFKQNSAALLDKGDDFKAITTNLKETEAFGFLVLRSVPKLVSGEKGRYKERNWSFLPKFNQTNSLHSQTKQQKEAEDLCHVDINKSGKVWAFTAGQNVLNQLKSSELIIQEIEVGLQDLFRSVVRTRVSLLNVLNNQ